MHDIFHAIVVVRIEYAAPAWPEMCSATDHARLDSLLRRSKRLGYCSDDLPAVADLFSAADDELFRRTTSNPNHFLHPYLPGETDVPYQLRIRPHLFCSLAFLDPRVGYAMGVLSPFISILCHSD